MCSLSLSKCAIPFILLCLPDLFLPYVFQQFASLPLSHPLSRLKNSGKRWSLLWVRQPYQLLTPLSQFHTLSRSVSFSHDRRRQGFTLGRLREWRGLEGRHNPLRFTQEFPWIRAVRIRLRREKKRKSWREDDRRKEGKYPGHWGYRDERIVEDRRRVQWMLGTHFNNNYIISIWKLINKSIIDQVYVLKRPYVDEFLARVGEKFECVLFTASLAKVR